MQVDIKCTRKLKHIQNKQKTTSGMKPNHGRYKKFKQKWVKKK